MDVILWRDTVDPVIIVTLNITQPNYQVYHTFGTTVWKAQRCTEHSQRRTDSIKANPARSMNACSLYQPSNLPLIVSSIVLNFAYVEELEMKKDKGGVFAMFDKFIDDLHTDLEAIESQINSANSSFESSSYK